MASTNQTTYYELPQYISTDKPTYLTDWNQAMAKIDASIHAAKALADTNALNIGDLASLNTTIKSSIVAALNEVYIGASSVGSLSNLNTTDKSNVVNAINEVNGKANGIGSLLDLDTASKSSIVSAINEVKGEADTNSANIENFNLTEYDDLTITNATNVTNVINYLKIATNSDSSLAKIYGTLSYEGTGGQNYFTIGNTTLRPESDITINCAGILRIRDANNLSNISTIDLIIRTTGAIEIDGRTLTSGWFGLIILFPCLYFIKDFGDTPISS